MDLFPRGRVYDFMGKRLFFMGVSLVACILSVLAFVWPGAKYGTDFKGGTEIEVEFKASVEPQEIRAAVIADGFSNPDVIRVAEQPNKFRYLVRVQEVQVIAPEKQVEIEQALCFGESLPAARCPDLKRPSEVKFSPGGDKITLRYHDAPDLDAVKIAMKGTGGVSLRRGVDNPRVVNARENKVEILLEGKGDQMMHALRTKLGESRVPENPLRSEWIGPKAGAQLRDAAITAVAISIVFIMAYVAFRFDPRFAPGGVVALAHDAIIAVGGMIFLGRELNLGTVAAVLTVIGYSINDTVIVYDRVRETLSKKRGLTLVGTINQALSDMLSRTVLTSSTVVMSLLAFFVWGTGSLKDFALCLIIGVIAGTYSSIYVALPLTAVLDQRIFSRLGRTKKA